MSSSLSLQAVRPIAIRMFLATLGMMSVTLATCWTGMTLFHRPSLDYAFTSCPTSFFIAGLVMLLAGALLGIASLTTQRSQLVVLSALCLVSGAVFVGLQAYGLWILWPARLVSENTALRVSIILVGLHLMATIAALQLISFAFAVELSRPFSIERSRKSCPALASRDSGFHQVKLVSPGHMIDQTGLDNRILMKVCSAYWILLGLIWSGLLCSFAISL